MKRIQMGMTGEEIINAKASSIDSLLNLTNQSRSAIINAVNKAKFYAASD